MKLIEPTGNRVIKDWIGGFNLTYTYGGKLRDGNKLVLNVFNQNRIEKTWNVMGLIKGEIEPGND